MNDDHLTALESAEQDLQQLSKYTVELGQAKPEDIDAQWLQDTVNKLMNVLMSTGKVKS